MPHLPFDQTRALEIGAAGEHLVCADLLLSGYRAFLAAQGSTYDVIVDVGDRLIRIAVKSTMGPRSRPGRPASRGIYMFAVGRRKRDSTGKTSATAYDSKTTDLVAMVAFDTKTIAYCEISRCKTMMHFEAVDGSARTSKFGPKTQPIRQMGDFSFSLALEGFLGEDR